jgi:hypothetical protein
MSDFDAVKRPMREVMMGLRNDIKITVCSECLTASCWLAEFMCDKSRDASTVQKTVGELRALKLEHPDNWSKLLRAEKGMI